MHPPANRRCQVYIPEQIDGRNLDRCINEGTHWELWPGCVCPEPRRGRLHGRLLHLGVQRPASPPRQGGGVNEPEEFMSEMNEGAIAQHELYEAWVQAGFTPDQALDLVKAIVVEMVRRGGE